MDHVNPGYAGVTVVSGWAFDLDTTASIHVMAYFIFKDGSARWASRSTGDPRILASWLRPDVEAAYHRGFYVGFGAYFEIDYSEVAYVCVVALNVGPGDHSVLGCKPVTSE